MFRSVKVFRRMFVFGGITAPDVPADQAHAQVNPRISQLYAFFTHMLICFPEFDLIEVSTFFPHRSPQRHRAAQFEFDSTTPDSASVIGIPACGRVLIVSQVTHVM
jgi:hypothetical protein